MSFPGGGWLFDQIRSTLNQAAPDVLLEWAAIIEKEAKRACGDQGARIIFRGVLNQEGRFSLDVDATDSDAILCLLNAIQSYLNVMPEVPKEFYGAMMDAIVNKAEEEGKLDGPWHF